MNKYKWLLPVLILLSACSITKKYQQPDISTQSLYRDVKDTTGEGMAHLPWRSLFADTLLQELIAAGLQQNLDLKIAVERIAAAKAGLLSARGAFLPEVNGQLSVKESRLSYPQGFGLFKSTTQYDAGLSAAWEADIWGRLSAAKRAALAGLLKSEAAQRAVQTQLVAAIAGNYFTLLALDEQLLVLEKTVANRVADVATMQSLKASNVVTGAAVVQSEASRYAAAVAIPDLKKQIRETENAICILLAQPAGGIKRTQLAAQQMPATLETGVPAQLLQNRPDVKQAELAFRMAFENTNVARTYFYPALNITAGGGFSSFDLKDWFTPTGLFGNIAGGVTQPIFNRNTNKARLATAAAQQQEAWYLFQQSLLTAGEEVSDALYAYTTATEKESIRVRQLQALEKSVDFTRELLRYSSATNYTDVLVAEQGLLSTQMEHINDRLQKWQAVISLYRALGGGWK